MSNKIQILNETQVNHFFNLLVPEFEKEFSKIEEELLEEVKKIKDNFVTHAEVVKLKEEHEKQIEETNKLILINKTLKEIDKDFMISKKHWSNPLSTEKYLESLINSHKDEIESLVQRLAEKSLHVNQIWNRRDNMHNKLRAQLCMTSVASADEIEQGIKKAIEVKSFFEN